MADDLNDWSHVVTAGALRQALEGVPDDMPVILQKDAEGNGYSPLSSVDVTGYVYEPDTTWSGEVYSVGPDDSEDPDEDDPDAYVPEDGTPIVLLGPVN